jgi:predicted ester cyclase
MTTEQDNAAFVRAIHDAWNRRDFDFIASRADDRCDWVMIPSGQRFAGKDGIRQYAQGWASAFPNARVEDVNVIAGENGAIVEFVGRGEHTGPLQAPTGEIPPTGRHVDLPACEIYRITNGKIVGGGIYFDMVTLLSQLGLMPQPAGAS